LEGNLRGLAVVPRGHPNLHVWLGLRRALEAAAPEVVFLDEEPYSLAAAQVVFGGRGRWALVVYSKQNIAKRLPWPFSALRTAVLRAAHVVAVTDPTVAEVLRQQGCPAPIRLVPHAVDPVLYSPGDSAALRARLGLSGTVIGYVGRLVAEKGVADLLEAVARVEGRTRQPISVLVVGEGPERLRLEALASRLRCPVRFAGAVPHEEMPTYYRAMDVLVLPSRTTSRWREQFGRAIIEALACGVAVVGSDSGSIPNLVQMTSGLVYPEGDAVALAEALVSLLESPQKRRELACTGRQRVVERFSAEAVADTLFAVLSEARGLKLRSEG
jgi:glycosyltransferase involved in cell wall biosynthesis